MAIAPRPGDPARLLCWLTSPPATWDRNTAHGVFDLMLELARTQGTAFVVVTHDVALAARCSRQLTLVQGRLAEAQLAPSGV